MCGSIASSLVRLMSLYFPVDGCGRRQFPGPRVLSQASCYSKPEQTAVVFQYCTDDH